MALPTAYLTTTKNTAAILQEMRRAAVPDRFTYEFMKKLGYPSSSDRPLIGVLKALRFLDESGVPTERYRLFKDPAEAKAVMAAALREAYADVFAIDEDAHGKDVKALKGTFARLSEKSEDITNKMALTFRTLVEQADFDAAVRGPVDADPVTATRAGMEEASSVEVSAASPERVIAGVAVHHDVHIHLPATTDVAVYDAIFKSIRANLT